MNGKYIYWCSTLVYFSVLSHISVHAQNVQDVRKLSESLDEFAVKFLAKISRQIGDSSNLAVSPYTVWNLLNILREGALGNTATELQNALGISPNQNNDDFRRTYQKFTNYLSRQGDSEVALDTTNSIFTAAEQELKPEYLRIVQNFYNAEIKSVDFKDVNSAASIINNRIKEATRGRISNFVKPDDVENAEVFLSSVLFFKGMWVNQFNKTETTTEAFYDDNGKQIGEVSMMNSFNAYPFSLVLDGKAIAAELPYKGNVSMIAILPKRGYTLASVLDTLENTSFSKVLDALEQSVIDFGDDPVYMHIPKFSIISDLTINVILDQMGIRDLLNDRNANLLGMFYHLLHVSRVLQRAEIEVNEEGTVASAVAGSVIEYKTTPAKFVANKPFAYFIVDKISRAIIFAGKFSNPRK